MGAVRLHCGNCLYVGIVFSVKIFIGYRILNSMGLGASGVIRNINPYVRYVRRDEAGKISRTYLKKGAIEFNESTA